MKLIISYLLLFLTVLTTASVAIAAGKLPPEFQHLTSLSLCSLVGGIGGVCYCLRAIYLNVSVKKQWGDEWVVWYFLRPVVSMISGAVSFVFIKAGLLVLESGSTQSATNIGFYALAFIAGLNVDKFINKVEVVSQTIWGIEKSRSADFKKENDE